MSVKRLRKVWIIMVVCMMFTYMVPANLYAEEIVNMEETEGSEVTVDTEETEGSEVAVDTEETKEEKENEEIKATSSEEEEAGQEEVDTDGQDHAEATTTTQAQTQTTLTSGSAPTATVQAAKPAAKPKPVINIKKKKITIKKGTKKKLAFTVKNTSKKKIKWTSSDKSVATVNSKGVVKVKGGGKCIITARVKGTDIKDTIIVKGRDYYYMRVKTTGYCNCRSCAGRWAGSRTASGRYPRANHTIAVDRRVIKLGTRVKIGKITYVAEDVGGGVRGRMIDIYYSSHSKAHRHGVKYRTAKIYF